MGIYLPIKLRLELEAEAERTGLKMSTIIQQCLKRELSRLAIRASLTGGRRAKS